LLRIEERPALPVLAGAVAGKVAGMARKSAADLREWKRESILTVARCARGLLPKGMVPRPLNPPRRAPSARILVRQNPRPSRLAISPLTLRSRPLRPPVRPMRSESTPSLEFDRFARFAMTPLLKLKISSHLRIQRLRSTLPKHPEFAVSDCICYGYETPESPLYLAFQFHYLTYASQNHCHAQSRLYRTDTERQMRPSDWRSPLKIGDGLCRKLIGKGQLWLAFPSQRREQMAWR
jgi:hypothetical protein